MGRLPQDSELVLFRIAQECLTNIHRHAKCSSAFIRLSNSGGKLAMEIRDDGQGIDKELQRQIASGQAVGVGLRGMRERVCAIGGTFAIESNENGTSVLVTLPHRKRNRCNGINHGSPSRNPGTPVSVTAYVPIRMSSISCGAEIRMPFDLHPWQVRCKPRGRRDTIGCARRLFRRTAFESSRHTMGVSSLRDHPKAANEGHLKTGQR